MQDKYKVFNELDIEYIDLLLNKADLTHDEYWTLKYSIGNKTNEEKVCRLDICDRLSFSFATLSTVKRVALAKIYKVFKDHMEKLKD